MIYLVLIIFQIYVIYVFLISVHLNSSIDTDARTILIAAGLYIHETSCLTQPHVRVTILFK
jgi:hypothetical protein